MRIRIYLDQEVYDDLVEMAKKRDMKPPHLMSFVLTDWAS